MEGSEEGEPGEEKGRKGEGGIKMKNVKKDEYIPTCSWCGKPYYDCKCGK